jgi:hypothetical protein
MYDAGSYNYSSIVFKGIHPPQKRRFTNQKTMKTHPSKLNVNAGTGNIHTSVVVYITFHSGDIVNKNKFNK